MKKILITTSTFGEDDPSPLKRLESQGLNYILNPHKRKVTTAELLELTQNCVGVIAGLEDYSSHVLKQLPHIKVISRVGVGVDAIDLDFAKSQGIKVYNTPDCLTDAVAELTIGFVLGLLRHIPQMSAEMHNGVWQKQMGNLLKGKNVGIIGFGKIGQRVAELLIPFDVHIAYCDIEKKVTKIPSVHKTLDELCSWLDICLIHAAGGSKAIISESHMRKMKRGSLVVNVSRGSAVDEEALYQLLKDKHLGGAALDVFAQEPYKGPLTTLKNVVLTPHIGSYAKEARIIMENQAVENLLKGLSS